MFSSAPYTVTVAHPTADDAEAQCERSNLDDAWDMAHHYAGREWPEGAEINITDNTGTMLGGFTAEGESWAL